VLKAKINIQLKIFVVIKNTYKIDHIKTSFILKYAKSRKNVNPFYEQPTENKLNVRLKRLPIFEK